MRAILTRINENSFICALEESGGKGGRGYRNESPIFPLYASNARERERSIDLLIHGMCPHKYQEG